LTKNDKYIALISQPAAPVHDYLVRVSKIRKHYIRQPVVKISHRISATMDLMLLPRYTLCLKKRPTLSLSISSPDINWLSKFFQWHILQKIFDNTLIKYPIHLDCIIALPCGL